MLYLADIAGTGESLGFPVSNETSVLPKLKVSSRLKIMLKFCIHMIIVEYNNIFDYNF